MPFVRPIARHTSSISWIKRIGKWMSTPWWLPKKKFLPETTTRGSAEGCLMMMIFWCKNDRLFFSRGLPSDKQIVLEYPRRMDLQPSSKARVCCGTCEVVFGRTSHYFQWRSRHHDVPLQDGVVMEVPVTQSPLGLWPSRCKKEKGKIDS